MQFSHPISARRTEFLLPRKRCGQGNAFRAFFAAGMGRWIGILLAWAVPFWAAAEDASVSFTNLSASGYKLDPKYGLVYWIWTTETHDQQICRFWKRVDIPENASVVRATMVIAADDAYRLVVDGREIGQGTQWNFLSEYNLTKVFGPGEHILAVECFNEYLAAGLIAELRVQMRNGQSLEVPTDTSWKIVPNNEEKWETRRKADPHWAAAVIKAKFGEGSWNGRTVRFFYPPPVQPIVVTVWQSTWFRAAIFSVCSVLAVLCLWLFVKLAGYSQRQQVIRRERARIARDIHDDLTAGLTQLALFGEVAKSELPDGSEARLQVAKICEKARSLSSVMNEIIWMVNSHHDTFRNFTSYLCKYAEVFLEPTPIRCRFDLDEEMPDIPCDLGVRRNLFLGVKEALNNAVRHSGASELTLQIHCHEQQVLVAIEDNGRGFDPASAGAQRNGLSNMKVRAAEAGGVCRLASRPGAGCRVEFAVARARVVGGHLKFWKSNS